MSLESEIQNASLTIKTDSYAMSVGELINLYRNKEIDLHPQFQRFFRWTDAQKTRLIESILLGIPLPPIFVAQRPDGVWDVVDGLQRLSAILQFVGELQREDGSLHPPLVLEEAQYLPSLRGKRWEAPKNPADAFDSAQRLFIKRAKLDLNIILKQSDENAKYELFQRLNTGGSQLSDQEVRNCLLIMIKPAVFDWMRKLGDYPPFVESIALSDRAIEEQFDLELILRFLVFRSIPLDRLRGLGDLGDFLTHEMMQIAREPEKALRQRLKTDEAAFRRTFDLLEALVGPDAFRRYDAKSKRYLGGFLISAYEAVALGLAFNLGDAPGAAFQKQIPERVKKLWAHKEFLSSKGSGVPASSRIPKVIPLGRALFKP